MDVSLWAWAAVIGGIVIALLVDLLVFHREAHTISMREAALTSTIWIAVGVAFGLGIWVVGGGEHAGEYFAGYLIEKALAVDNIFVFALIFSAFAVPARLQHRVLFFGVLGALITRGAFIAAGASLLETFHWVLYVFGGFLIWTGVKMARHTSHQPDPVRNPLVRGLRRIVPVTDHYEGQRFLLRRDGRWVATPLLAVLLAVESTDVVFAADSIPAIFAVTEDPFLVFTSNAFAILGLRALFFLLAGAMDRFCYLSQGLAAVLVFVGVKLLVAELWHIPISASLAVIIGILTVSVGASLARPVPVDREHAAPR